MLDAVQSPLLTPLPQIKHGFFTRRGGVSDGIYNSLNCGPGSNDSPQNVTENRRRVAGQLGVTEGNLLSCAQIHSATAVLVTHPFTIADRPDADALVTNVPGLALGTLSADCTPVLFADPVANVVAAAHAGWKGALGGILANTLTAMEQLGAKRDRILAAIGPCIHQLSYEVGPNFPAPFLAESLDFSGFFVPSPTRPGHFLFDLPGFVKMRLQMAGVQQISASPADTFLNESDFFSYRRTTHRGEQDYGRQISAICLA
jgi:polyphenol oxidase